MHTTFGRLAPLTVLLLVVLTPPLDAQELEPGAYTVSPVGINVLNLTYGLSTGDVTFDPSLPVEEASARIQSFSIAAARSISFAGRSATALVAVPVVGGHVTGIYLGQPAEVRRTGFGDMRVRLGVNLYGEPARRLPEFVKTPRSKLNIGASVMIVLPTGQYDPNRIINLGLNRAAFKPEAAIIRNYERWMFEIYGGAWLFTSNDDFFGGHTRSQDPIVSVQFSLRRTFRPGLWISGNANFYRGGRTHVDDVAKLDFQSNSRVGTTLAVPITRRNAFRLAVSQGAYTTIGADFFNVSASFQQTF
jgi:outer membrane putative beta-barrel porin/alpha-amylase